MSALDAMRAMLLSSFIITEDRYIYIELSYVTYGRGSVNVTRFLFSDFLSRDGGASNKTLVLLARSSK